MAGSVQITTIKIRSGSEQGREEQGRAYANDATAQRKQQRLPQEQADGLPWSPA
jgi:hypothetical protein